MRELSVVSLGILLLLALLSLLVSAMELVEFGWTMFSVREMKVPLWIVGTFHGVFITVVTVRMHLWSARFIYGEQLNWLFTEHGTTEELKLGLSWLCSEPFQQFSVGSGNLEQLLAVLGNFEQNISLEHISSPRKWKKELRPSVPQHFDFSRES